MKGPLIILLSLLSLSAFGQTREEILQEFMKERKQMMQQMIQMFQDDFGGDDILSDKMDPFGSNKSFKGAGSSVEIEEKYETDGSISIIITPKKENMALDIQTKDGMITIKSEMNVEEENKKGSNSFKSFSRSSFSRSIGIPQGYSAKSPTASGKGIKISLIPSAKVKKILSPKKKPQNSNSGLVPIKKKSGEDTL
jgi:HSP20 family molecular chaperone IbpA